ncbi:unnamed protein product [Clonostachys byssicola]|uniref:Uncharacterized protein n=1 Tax=Clonostachys byssicola TaxID=160290 RepID=A0A9N9USP1_9HYPO|nr:unnamed protein product [Clonostachys byssicola]
MPSAQEVLLKVGEKSTEKSWLDLLIQKELMEIGLLLPEMPSSDCLLIEIGDYLCRATETIAQLAGRLANGNHIHTYAQLNVNQATKETDLSELGVLDVMTTNHSAIKVLANKLQCASKEITSAWSECSARPDSTLRGNDLIPFTSTPIFPEPEPVRDPQVATIFTASALATAAEEPPSQDELLADSIEVVDDIDISYTEMDEPTDASIMQLLQSLSRRGKGLHYCPYKSSCTKGGFSPAGSPVLFERNSAFR